MPPRKSDRVRARVAGATPPVSTRRVVRPRAARVVPPVTANREDAPNVATVPPFQMDPTQLQTLMAQGIATALATYEAARTDSASGNSGIGVVTPNTSRNHTRACTYKDFMACKPRNFYGDEGVVGLIRWIEKMEAVFRISACPDDCQVKYATCTLMDAALTWWNDHAKSMGDDTAYSMDWAAFKNLIINEYCPRQEIQALEQELWNLTMKGSEVTAYTARFNDLASLCPGMVNPEYKKTERYIWGLASPVQGLVTASRPSTFDSAKQLAYQLTEQCIRQGTMTPQTESSKRRFQGQARETDKQAKTDLVAVCTAIANTPASGKSYIGSLPLCTKCNYHHFGACKFCEKCKYKGHTAETCRRILDATTVTPATGARVCYECNQPGHFQKDCPKLRQRGGPARAFVIGTEEAHQEPNEDTGMFPTNNTYIP